MQKGDITPELCYETIGIPNKSEIKNIKYID
jgi:hypothetical protein